jgi:hypothetical protein
MSTPLTSKRILTEKLSGVRRLTTVLVVPFATIFLFEKWWYASSSWGYVVLSALTVVTYLALIAWIALAVGLRFPNQLTAIVGAVSVVSLWAVGLASVGPLMQYLNIEQGTVTTVLRALSPIDMIAAVQRSAQYGIVGRGAPPPES